jgi:asparagine synthase (glutamine-hydrolysing)
VCGIAGWVDGTRGTPEPRLLAIVQDMARALAHRGPDSDGSWADESAGVAFGHTRLAILDLTAQGAQPMISRDGRYVLSYNGEAYNFRDLRKDLRKHGVRFAGASDTEVVVEAIAAWGIEETLRKVNGMYAFAVWDSVTRTLTLARDRLGEKPLYYWSGAGQFLFASELGALQRHPAFDNTVDENAIALLLRYGCIPAPWSIFRGTKKLLPGHTLTIRCSGGITPDDPVAQWSLFDAIGRTPTLALDDDSAAADALEELLLDAVRLRMESDVPVGAFLSGGIDSSTVVALMQRASNSQVNTFSIGSGDSAFDEGVAAARVAQHLGTNHVSLCVTAADAMSIVPRLPSIYGEPFADPSEIPTFAVSQLARQHVTVSLSGDGGDELFGGYNRHRWIPALWRRTHRLPAPFRRAVSAAIRTAPPLAWQTGARLLPPSHRPRDAAAKASKVAQVLAEPTAWAMYQRVVSQWQQPEDVVRGASEPPTFATTAAMRPGGVDLLTAMMAIDATTWLPDDILVKVDRASMAVSLEARVPLLDHRLVEFAFALPEPMRFRAGKTKWLLREVLARYVPRELTDRPKTGFQVPIASWLRGPLKGWAADLLDPELLRRQGYLRPEPIATAWRSHSLGRADRSQELWCVLMFQQWLDHQTRR